MIDWKTVQQEGIHFLDKLSDSIPLPEASPFRRDSWTVVDPLEYMEHPEHPHEEVAVLFRVEGLNPQGQPGVYEFLGIESYPEGGHVEVVFNGSPACVKDYETPGRRGASLEDWIQEVVEVTARACVEQGGLPSVWAGEDVGSMLARAELNVTAYSDHGVEHRPGTASFATLEGILNTYLAPTPVTVEVLPVTPELLDELCGSRPYILRHHVVSEGQSKVTYPPAAVGPGLERVWWDRMPPRTGAYFSAFFEGQHLSTYRSDCAVDAADFASAVAAVHGDAPARTWTDWDGSVDWFAVRLNHPAAPSVLVLPNVRTGFDLHIDDDGASVSLSAEEGSTWRAQQSAQRDYEIRWGRWLCENPVTPPDPAVVSRLLAEAVGEMKTLVEEEKTA